LSLAPEAIRYRPLNQSAPAMHKLLVLTVDPEKPTPEPTVVVKCSDGTMQTYHFVETIDGLHQYRNESLSEEDARRMIV